MLTMRQDMGVTMHFACEKGKSTRPKRPSVVAVLLALGVIAGAAADADGLRRGHAFGFVEDQPAVNRLALLLAGHRMCLQAPWRDRTASGSSVGTGE